VTTVSADEADTTPGLLRGRRHSSWNAGVHAYLQLLDATGMTHHMTVDSRQMALQRRPV